VRFGDREYPVEVRLKIELLAPRGTGVELAARLDRLESLPNRQAWPAYLRRALVPLAAADGKLLAKLLRPGARLFEESAASYINVSASAAAETIRGASALRSRF
jgi:hypothetical protein